jgi:L-threonylcarbamoyladenylate synthase
MNEAELLKHGKIGVMPTDTLYGLLASAFDERAIRRVYEVKKRNPIKKCITLIASLNDLKLFGVILTEKQIEVLNLFWPGPVSIIFKDKGAFRFPADTDLVSFLKESGPCIAPSANPEGFRPAETIEEARAYFGDTIDFYKDGGKLFGAPSTLITLDEHGAITVLRNGKGSIPWHDKLENIK